MSGADLLRQVLREELAPLQEEVHLLQTAVRDSSENPPPPRSNLISAAEVCARCRFSRRTLDRRVHAGLLAVGKKLGSRRWWRQQDVDDYLAGMPPR